MHASNIALLVLAASAAAPVFSAPLSGRALSDLLISNRMSSSVGTDEGKSIEDPISRKNDGSSTYSGPETLDRLAAREDTEASVNTFLSSLGYTSSHVAKDRGFDHFLFSRDNEIHARGLWGTLVRFFLGLFHPAAGINSNHGRHVTPGQLAARDDSDTSEFFNNLSISQAMIPRDEDLESLRKSFNALLQSRDYTTERDEHIKFPLAAILPREFTPEQKLALALLGRSFDELD